MVSTSMISGRDALTTVEQAISRVRSDEGQLDAALRSAMEQSASLRRAEADGFRVLARIKLDAAVRDRLIDDLDASERAAFALIEEHRRRLEDLSRRRAEEQVALDRAEAAKHEVDQALADALDRLDARRHGTMERIRSDPSWQQASSRVEAVRQIATNADQKASQAEQDLAIKRKPYEDDPLFTYLWARKHGQAEDTSGRLVRFVDRWVADLVGYRDARANYAMLREIPLRLREHADNKRRDVEAAERETAAIERAALIADGIEAIEASAEAARDAMRKAESEVAAITARVAAIDAERQATVGPGDAGVYDKAVDMLAQALAAKDLRDLYESAVRTPAPTDDQVVRAITETRRKLQSIDGELARLRTDIREIAQRRTELESARDRARRSGYDDPRGTFDGGQDVLGEVIGGILRGAMRGGDLDRVLRGGYRSPVPRADPDFGGRGSGPSWPGPWDGPDTESSGGHPGRHGHGHGGGWRTGGSF
jgi:hypothetical protein